MKLSEFIGEIMKVIPTPDTWCQNMSEWRGRRCIYGAADEVIRVFQLEKFEMANKLPPGIVAFNDAEGRTHAEVLTFLTKIKDKAESQEMWAELAQVERTAGRCEAYDKVRAQIELKEKETTV